MGSEYKDRERLADRWLDAVLKQYGETQPRIGLEGRVLANLRAESERLAKRRNWRHVLAAVTAIMLVSGTIVFVRGPDIRKQVVAKPEVPGVRHASGAPLSDHTIADRAAAKGRRPVDQRPRKSAQASRPARTLETASEPRLEQFPSPQPLSEQELALASYVARFPHEAGLVLQVKAEISNFALPDQTSNPGERPILRQLSIRGSTVPTLGKVVSIGSLDDPNSNHQFQLEVTVTQIR